MKNTLMIIVAAISLLTSCATSKSSETTKPTAYIQTNAQCGDCKERIEGVLNFEKGIIYSNMDLDTKIVEVKYNANKTSLEKIRNTIAAIGYNADDVKAVKSAQSALPGCCQPGGHD
ncbi:heavy-metal-associated domain-containing protein [Brumimicrobium oceani]|uniref:Heavy metal transporter n=1 Tax=Brumimicrobium oceani TaxID=2100725 RepID=A0A2U2X0M7_9FLAO|nr:heavy-metal-associated domain-containing protein [Brumimicrobium oceani]PWH81337.1 heavy metal transporter [Brumimicrobium oceani]